MPPGTEVDLTIIRDGKKQELTVELEARDASVRPMRRTPSRLATTTPPNVSGSASAS